MIRAMPAQRENVRHVSEPPPSSRAPCDRLEVLGRTNQTWLWAAWVDDAHLGRTKDGAKVNEGSREEPESRGGSWLPWLPNLLLAGLYVAVFLGLG